MQIFRVTLIVEDYHFYNYIIYLIYSTRTHKILELLVIMNTYYDFYITKLEH